MFRLVCDGTVEGILVAVIESRQIIYANAAACRMFGRTHDEFRALTIDSIHPGAALDAILDEFRALLRGDKTIATTIPCRRKDGTALLADISASKVTVSDMACCVGFFTDVTQRMENQTALHDGEDRYRALIEATNTGYVIIDHHGVVLDANAEYVRLSGHRSLREIIGRVVVEWTAPYEKEKNEAAIEACIENGQIRNFEIDYIDHAGRITPIEINATVFETNGTRRILTLCRDIAERRKNLRQIRESEEKFRKVFEESPYGMVLADARHRILRANASFCQLIGYTEDELLSRGFRDFVHPEELAEIDGNIALWEVGRFQIDKTETRYLTKNQETVWTTVTVTRIQGPDGELLYNLAIVEDVTERKRAQQSLLESEEMFRRLVEGAPEAIYVQTEGKISFVNSAACVLFGACTPSELVGSNLIERIHPDFREAIRKRVNRINQEQKENPPLEEVYLKLDGSPVPVEVSAVPVQFHGSNGALVFVRNVTERKRTEEALRNAQKLESLGVLAGGIAHDFNNLLGGLFGNIDLARLSVQQGDSVEALATLSSAMGVMERARALTRQLLTFSTGGAPVRRPIAMGQLLNHSVKFALSGSNVHCTFAIASDLWLCSGDENQIGQVIDNIVINARQAMPDGGTVTVRAENAQIEKGQHAILLDGDYVKVTISDTGVGIPKGMLQCIFDPFFSTKEQGSGLGLAITYSIIKRHEGAIDVDSEPGKGTRFNVYLPEATHQTVRPPEHAAREYRGTGCILIMDDEPFILSVASQIIQTLGFSTVTALCGDEALRIVGDMKQAGQTVHAAILDLTIPGGRGGKETVRELLELDPSIKTIVSSGYSDDPIMAVPHEYGFWRSLNKPYSIEEIANVLRDVHGEAPEERD